MFGSSEEILDNGSTTRHRVLLLGSPLSYADALRLLQTDTHFRSFLTEVLAKSKYLAFRWETPSVSVATAARPFEFVLIDYPSFESRKTDYKTYRSYFTTEDANHGIVTFKNISGDALLIVPSPRTDYDAYGHFASFLRHAPESQTDSLWLTIGKSVAEQMTDEPLWLSTAGGGVAWLHVRVDSTPKYYAFRPYRSAQYHMKDSIVR